MPIILFTRTVSILSLCACAQSTIIARVILRERAVALRYGHIYMKQIVAIGLLGVPCGVTRITFLDLSSMRICNKGP